MKIKSYIKGGNSFPIIVEKEGRDYFVKLRAGMSGTYALLNEWIGNQLGLQLNINTQNPIWIVLDQNIIIDNIYIEVKELILKSLGLNIAFPYQGEATTIKAYELAHLDREELDQIFLFDLLLLNIDRSSSNTNLMKIKDQILTVDFEASLLLQDIMSKKDLSKNPAILKYFKESPLYRPISEASIDQFLHQIQGISIEAIISGIPSSLLGDAERQLLVEGINKRKAKDWSLKPMMKALEAIQLETPKERTERIQNNQEAFKKRMKK